MNGIKQRLKSSAILKDRDITRLMIVTTVVFLLMGALSPRMFFTAANFRSMAFQMPELGFFSIAMMMVMLTGGRDLSIVGISNLSGITAAFLLRQAVIRGSTGMELSLYIAGAVLASLAVGVICGVINGLIVSELHVTPMLTTLGTLSLFTGVGIILTKAEAVSQFPPAFTYLGNHSILGIPVPMWLLIAALAVTAIVLTRTRYGFELKFLGSNPVASMYTGMRNRNILLKTYIYSGILCAVIGLEVLMRTDTAKADFGTNYTFQAIVCAVLGATNPNGGYAKVSCLVFAVLSLQFLSSGMNMLRISGALSEFVWGVLLIAVMTANYLVEQRREKKCVAAKTT